MCCCCNFALSQNRTTKSGDTPKVTKQKSGIKPVRSKALPLRQTDTLAYDNKIYRQGIKNAEYQNRGSEERRNINSGDPNAIQNRKVPEQQRAEPVK
jgi:hypothetical protein